MDAGRDREVGRRDDETRLRALRDQVALLVERLDDTTAGREVERRVDILAAEVRADTPLADVARTAGAGLVMTAARWDDLGVACARIVGQLLASIEGAVEAREDVEDAWAVAAELAELEWPRGAAEPEEAEAEAASPIDEGPEGIGGPIYPPGEEP